MRKNSVFIFFIFVLNLSLFAENIKSKIPEITLKFGKVSKEELTTTAFNSDTTSTAIMLFHTGDTKFTYKQNKFGLLTDHAFRIRILKEQGKDLANITIPYYSPTQTDEDKDDILNIEAIAYNLENGKVIKTRMKNKFIFRERYDKNTMIVKFTIPKIKVGSIIEYKYSHKTSHYGEIKNWEIQENIPVVHNKYHVVIPNVFIYNIESTKRNKIELTEKEGVVSLTQRTNSNIAQLDQDFFISARDLTFSSNYIEPLKQDEIFCWCPNDYKIQISFDLQGTNFPVEGYKPYTKNWTDVDKTLLNEDEKKFGKLLKSLINPFKEETIQIRNSDTNQRDKIIRTFQLLKNNITWNNQYRLTSDSPLKAKENGTGSNADLNFLFISMLKDLGIQAYPAVLSARDRGRLPIFFASINKLNTFIVAIEESPNHYLYLDGSMQTADFNVLPINLLVNKIRILNPQLEEKNRWINPMSLCKNYTKKITKAQINKEQVVGYRMNLYEGQEAIKFKAEQLKKDTSDFIKEKENLWNCKITNYRQESLGYCPSQIRESFYFTLSLDTNGDHLYINPLLLVQPISNPFIEAKRTLPIEFPYPYSHNESVHITIPEGYEIEEIPQSMMMITEDKALSCKYAIQQTTNQLTLNYTFQIKKSVLHANQYKQLQTIWDTIIEKSRNLIVLKKI